MVLYVILAYFVTNGSFWTFATIHIVLAAIAILFIWIGEAPKIVAYVAVFLSVIGAGTALVITLYSLTILSNLARG